jgi:hypothetical protein
MPESRPEPYATVARMRQEGHPESAIARHIGIGTELMWSKVAKWNGKNPDRKIPRPQSRPVVPRYVQAAEKAHAGMTQAEIAADMGITGKHVWRLLVAARKAGLLPPLVKRVEQGGLDTYLALYHKDAAPPRGRVSSILKPLSADEVHALLRRTRTGDRTLADTIARLLKECLSR